MLDFDPQAYDELTVLPPGRLRHHLAHFEEALAEALENGLRLDDLQASNLVTQALLFGFPSLAEALSEALLDGSGGSEAALRSARAAIRSSQPKVAELLKRGLVRESA